MPNRDEVFEVVDETGRVIGRAPRSECHRNPALIHRAAHVVVMNPAGKIYLQKRSVDKDIQPGRWDTSVGGHLAPGEDFEAGAKREMREELGLEGPLRFLYRYLWRTARETELVQTYLFVTGVSPRPDPAEIEEGRFFEPPEVEALLGSGRLTPNFEEEFRKLQAAGVL